MHGFSTQEDHPTDHLKQHQLQHPLNHGHSYMKNTRQRLALPQTKAIKYDENQQNRAKGLAADDDIAISDEQILYFTNIHSNEKNKGNKGTKP